MNVEWFSRPLAALGTGMPAGLTGADRVAGWLIYTFVQGKFWTMFSLLFGMGFAVMLTRAERAGRPFLRPYLRRLAASGAVRGRGVHAEGGLLALVAGKIPVRADGVAVAGDHLLAATGHAEGTGLVLDDQRGAELVKFVGEFLGPGIIAVFGTELQQVSADGLPFHGPRQDGCPDTRDSYSMKLQIR